jgi:hypothetical protein
MKKVVLIIAILLLTLTIVPIWALAHSGGTDSSGGHYDHSTGEYHYHHGYPAHQHTGGECPYNKGSSSSSSSSYTPSNSDDTDWVAIGIGAVLVTLLCAGVVFANQEVFDKLSETVAKFLIGVWISIAVPAIVCFVKAPGAMTLIVIVGIFVSLYINSLIEDHRRKREKQKDEEDE